MTPLPTVVISGFLGAGKTTLLNRLLADGIPGKRAGVIVNDFGKLNVDASLVRTSEHPLVELSSGCVCCTLQLGLSEAVRTLAARGDLDVLVIETSGISVTSALLHALNSPELIGSITMRQVIAVVDARRYPQVLHALPVIRDQVVHADLIVLNHCDEVNAATIDAAKVRLRQDNARAPIFVAEHGKIDFANLMAEAATVGTVEHHQHHDMHWNAYEVVVPEDYDPDRLLTLVNQLPAAIERVKGFVTWGDDHYVLQKVGPFPASLQPWRAGLSGASLGSLVVIAREPMDAKLEALLPDFSIRPQRSVNH